MSASSPRDHHHRRSIRLPDYDYSQSGAYFVTVCTQQRETLFGAVGGDVMRLNEYGEIVAAVWHDLPQHYAHIALDAFVVMPNHVHGIVIFEDPSERRGEVASPRNADIANLGAATAPLRATTLGQVVAYFKYQSTKRINELRNTAGIPVWQRNYYERVIRNDREFNAVRDYIQRNPLNWARDHENPQSRR